MLSWLKDKIKGVKTQQDCVFCKIRDDPTQEQLNKSKHFLCEDEQFYVIHDINKASAQEHILVITKKHIRSALDVKDKSFFLRMRELGIQALNKLQNQSRIDQKQQYRFGFHLPPYNSVDHIHLHGFLLPFTETRFDKFFYGWMMTGVQEMIKKLNNKK